MKRSLCFASRRRTNKLLLTLNSHVPAPTHVTQFRNFHIQRIPLNASTGGASGKPPSPGPKSTRAETQKRPTEPAEPSRGVDDDGVFQAVNIGPQFPQFSASGLRDAAITTVVGLAMVFLGGVAYVSWYKHNVLDKIEQAFAPGYDPALELATHNSSREPDDRTTTAEGVEEGNDGPWTQHLRRQEQDVMDNIVQGREAGRYYVLLGPKGVGKTTMIFDAMQAIDADGVSMCDAHPDLEVFRLRLGKAINFEFYEDSQTGLFQRRDPKEGGAALDIERALNKVEKVALRVAKKRNRPLVLIFNNVHFFNHDEEGRNMLLQLQQYAESWAASGILTMVFSTDDFWPYQVMRKVGTRMHVLSIADLSRSEAVRVAMKIRKESRAKMESREVFQNAVDVVGGRPSYLNRVSRASNMQEHAERMLSNEQAWLMSQIGLIPDCDDDVMDEQKWSSCSWLLLREFVKIRQQQEKECEEAIASGKLSPHEVGSFDLPSISYWKCRQIMTRTDFMEELDRLNIIAIDVRHDIRPDSELILGAARRVVEEEGFDEVLDNVRDRIDEIESLHRTSEVTYKDLGKGDRIRLLVDKGGEKQV